MGRNESGPSHHVALLPRMFVLIECFWFCKGMMTNVRIAVISRIFIHVRPTRHTCSTIDIRPMCCVSIKFRLSFFFQRPFVCHIPVNSIILNSISSKRRFMRSLISEIVSFAICSSLIICGKQFSHRFSPSLRYFLDRHNSIFDSSVVDLCHYNTSLINSASSTRASLCSLILVSQSL